MAARRPPKSIEIRNTVFADRVLVMKPEPRKEFSDRRVELAYELKAVALKTAALLNEAEALKLDHLFVVQRGQDGLVVKVGLAVQLLT